MIQKFTNDDEKDGERMMFRMRWTYFYFLRNICETENECFDKLSVDIIISYLGNVPITVIILSHYKR